MATNLSRFFKRRRLALGFRPGQVARLMEYKSIVGACNKLIYFEERGEIVADLFFKLAAALRITQATIQRLLDEDQQQYLEAWNRWADQPIEPYVVIRAIPAFPFTKDIPPECTTQEEMEEFAGDIAERLHKQVVLVLTRRLRIVFDESAANRSVHEAQPGQCDGPYMRLAGSRKKFLMGDQFRQITEPELPGPKDK